MGRAKVIYTNEHPYHINARCINREWFDVPMDYCFGLFINVFVACIQKYKVQLHAFVLMNNHFHMIVSTPRKNIGEFMCYFMTQTSKAIAVKSQRINHIYGGRNHKSLIMTPEYYAHCLKYVYRNPVKALMCSNVEDYRWSTISKQNNKMKSLLTPIDTGHDIYLPRDHEELINWLNEPVSEELDEVLRKAMKRPIFEAKPVRSSRQNIDLRSWLYKS